MGIYNVSSAGSFRLRTLYKLVAFYVSLHILTQLMQIPSLVWAYPSALHPASLIRKVPQEFASAPSYNFPGSITVCRQDYYKDCTTLVEMPNSVQRRCTEVPKGFNDRISSLEIKNGCCEFHRGFDCKGGRLLVACNERKGTLFGITNNQISSWKCYYGDM
ncbi:hypothetical protein EV426DRAFT_702833 [Tirmania nivea]|nr:hypothetical protein EV426DRAFT_702833 [Tirmania nivea]